MSTPTDLATFLLMHRNRGMHAGRQLIPAESLSEMYARRRPWLRYGLGFVLGPGSDKLGGCTVWIYHTGSTGTMFWLDFERDIIGVLLTQTQRSSGRKAPESQRKISRDAPAFIRVVKKKVDAIFGWTEHRSQRSGGEVE